MEFPGTITGHAITVRPRTGADLPLIRDIYITHRWEEMNLAHGWTDDQKLAFLADQFRLQCHHYDTHYHDADFLIVEVDGIPVGRLYLWGHNPADIRIVEIGFLPAWRGKGIGGGLLRCIQGHARAQGKGCSIHVEMNNPARRLYDRLGFREVKPVGPYVLLEWQPA